MGHSDDDSDYAEYGTALEAIEEDDATRKRPIAVQDQVAVDERGRRRFHGAFTGGFSAGYFNTVGSKEGWTPSNFKSTRGDRGAFKSQNVMDFMDDEDKGAFGIAPQILRPTEDFADKNDSRGRKRPLPKHAEGTIPGAAVLEQILQPSQETVGIKILIKMGWRPGKGVGPRIDRKAKRPKLSSPLIASTESDLLITSESEPGTSGGDKFYGCVLPPEFMQQRAEDSDSSSDEIEEAKTLLAPDDVNSLLCNPKENTFGLGYKGLDRNTLAPATGDTDLYGAKLKFRVENKNLSISGQAFGVGAFEENDDDIYSREDMSQYDFALETPEERKRRKTKEDMQKRKKKNKENCMEGFQASKSSKIRRKSYPAPHLPPNFQPFHAAKRSRFEISKSSESDEKQDAISKGLARHSLSITERQVLIEDDVNKMTLLKKSATSQSNIETLEVKPAEEIQLDQTSSSKPPNTPSEDDTKRRIDRLKKFTQVLQAYSSNQPETGQNAAFKPFMKNPEKQERYEKYLTLRDAGFSECLKDLQPSELTEWEREREKMEFERASKLYKPMNSILANRFTSAKSHDISHLEPEKEIIPEKDPKDDPKVAARMKLFGKLTHRVMEWHPDKLVCKRFNIPHPYPDSKFVGIRGDPSVKSNSITNETIAAANMAKPAEEVGKKKSLFDNLDFSKPPPGLLPHKTAQVCSSTGSPMESSAEATGAPVLEFQKDISDDNRVSNVEDVEIVERPSLDLFKEIFADSSDSENEEEEADVLDVSKGKASQQFIRQHIPLEKAAVRDDKPLDKVISSNNGGNSLPSENESVNQQRGVQKRGVFDRIDLDMLQNNAQRLQSSNRKPSRRSSESGDDEMNDAYGPAPPKNPFSSISRPHQSGSGGLSAKSLANTPAPTYQSKLDDRKKEVNTEEVIWVEKSALSDGSSKRHVKSKKHSSKKSRRKRSKKEKRKSHKSKKSKHKKKDHKPKSKSKRDSKGGESSASEDDSATGSDASSDSSVTINDSLDNRALLAKLKQFTRSN